MIRALLAMVMLAGCGGSAATAVETASQEPTAPTVTRSEAMCVAFEIVADRIRPALATARGDALEASFAGLQIVIAGADIVDLAERESGLVADDLRALGEAYMDEGAAVQAEAANPNLPAEQAGAGTEAYDETASRYDC